MNQINEEELTSEEIRFAKVAITLDDLSCELDYSKFADFEKDVKKYFDKFREITKY